MSGRYAAETHVTVEASRVEIQRRLERAGANQFLFGQEPGRAVVAFRLGDRQVRISLPLPELHQYETTPGRGLARPPQQAKTRWQQATRQSWRQLALVLKAKLEAVEAGITTVEREFFADVILRWYVRLQTHRLREGGKSEPDGHLQYIPVERVPDLWEALQNAVQQVPKPWWEAHVSRPAREAGELDDSDDE